MKLISKFHDYYDGVLKNTVGDPSVFFKRESVVLPGNTRHPTSMVNTSVRCRLTYPIISFHIIGFCGEIIPLIEVQHESLDKTFYYTYDELCKKEPALVEREETTNNRFIKRSKRNKKILKLWLEDGIKFHGWWGWSGKGENQKAVDDVFFKGIFLNKRVPYYCVPDVHGGSYIHHTRANVSGGDYSINYSHGDTILLPRLQDYDFGKKYDAYTAYQKIEMFLTNQLVRPDLVEHKVPDVLKAQSKGFDKWSFRKEPSK